MQAQDRLLSGKRLFRICECGRSTLRNASGLDCQGQSRELGESRAEVPPDFLIERILVCLSELIDQGCERFVGLKGEVRQQLD